MEFKGLAFNSSLFILGLSIGVMGSNYVFVSDLPESVQHIVGRFISLPLDLNGNYMYIVESQSSLEILPTECKSVKKPIKMGGIVTLFHKRTLVNPEIKFMQGTRMYCLEQSKNKGVILGSRGIGWKSDWAFFQKDTVRAYLSIDGNREALIEELQIDSRLPNKFTSRMIYISKDKKSTLAMARITFYKCENEDNCNRKLAEEFNLTH